jgi:hypothetical protein
MYSFSEDAVITGAISTAWPVASDVAGWPSWDLHEQKGSVRGRLRDRSEGWPVPTGAPVGTFTVTAVEPERMWANEAGIPFGRLRDENRYQPLADGKIRVGKRAGGTGRSVRMPSDLEKGKGMRAGMHKASPRRRRKRGGVAEPRSQGESGDPFGGNEPTGHSKPRGPLIGPCARPSSTSRQDPGRFLVTHSPDGQK